MNIFVLDLDPIKAARYQPDKMLVKMVLETAQLLCNAHHLYGRNNKKLYKLTHKNHPCTKWVCSSRHNYYWLLHHWEELGTEYYRRYKKIHKSFELYNELVIAPSNIPYFGDRTPFILAMPEKYKCGDPVKSYRDYCVEEKKYAKWKNKNKPIWWK